MSIDSELGIILIFEAKDTDRADEELEIEESSRPDLRKRSGTNFGFLITNLILNYSMKL